MNTNDLLNKKIHFMRNGNIYVGTVNAVIDNVRVLVGLLTVHIDDVIITKEHRCSLSSAAK